MTPTLIAVAVQTIYFAVALLGSYIVFRFLKGTAQITRKGVQLGGSAAMFVVMFVLLNQYASKSREDLVSDFTLIETAQASQTLTRISSTGKKEIVKVSLSPATQLISSRDLAVIDRNEYYVDEDLRVAIKKPPDARWRIERRDAVEILGLSDIPSLGLAMDIMSSSNSKTRPAILTFTHTDTHTIKLSKDSIVESIPMDYNMYSDPTVMKSSLAHSLEVLKGRPVSQEELDSSSPMTAMISEQLVNGYQKMIDARLPAEKEISSALHVIFFTHEYLNRATVNRLFPRRNILDAAMNYLWSSSEFASGSMSNVYVNHARNLISFNGSVEVKNIELDGKRESDILVNNVAFLMKVGGNVAFVQLVYVSGEPVDVFLVLKDTLDSMQIGS